MYKLFDMNIHKKIHIHTHFLHRELVQCTLTTSTPPPGGSGRACRAGR